jgi:sRNA-binding carbon storage regulator CsrA
MLMTCRLDERILIGSTLVHVHSVLNDGSIQLAVNAPSDVLVRRMGREASEAVRQSERDSRPQSRRH